MRPSEEAAKAVIEAILEGAEMRFRPDQSDGSHDFDLLSGGSILGAVEVTSSADQARKELMASIADDRKGRHEVPAVRCRSSWLVELLPGASVNQVRRHIDEYLAAVESEHLESFSQTDAARHPSVNRLAMELCIDSGYTHASARSPIISILPPGDAGWVDSERLQTAV